MTATKVYPGMLDDRKEYFTIGDNVYLIQNGRVMSFFEVSEHPELAEIIQSEPETQRHLFTMCGDDPLSQQHKLARCRFGGLNFSADFPGDGQATADFIDCPLRGKCAGENIICRPACIAGKEITPLELTVLRQCSGNSKNWVIAGLLKMPVGSFNVLKTKVYQRLKIQTKQQSALMLVQEGLL